MPDSNEAYAGGVVAARSGTLDVYRGAGRLVRPLVRAATSVHEGLGLATLSPADLNLLTAAVYADREGIYFDASYVDSGLEPWEDAALRDYFRGCERILVAAAGSGREVLALAERGYPVDGFDCAVDLVQVARERLAAAGHSSQIWSAAPDSVPAGLTAYDGIVIGCGALSHIPGRPQRVAFLRQLRALLPAGGPLLVSYQSVLGRANQLQHTYRTARIVHHLRLARRSPEFGDALPAAFVHYFGPSDVPDELQMAGFRTLQVHEGGISHAIACAEAPDTTTRED